MDTDPAMFEQWGPCLSPGNDASEEMRVSWRAPNPVFSWEMKFGKKKDEMNVVRRAITNPSVPSKRCTVVLDGLEPATTYHYEIDRDPGKVYSFTTAPVKGSKIPVEFTILGDMHAYPCNGSHAKYYELMNRLAPGHSFCVTVGDSINDGEDVSHWNSFFRQAREYLPARPMLNATGNHDCGNRRKYPRFVEAWPHPYHDPVAGGYYHVTHGNVSMVFIDSSNGGRFSPVPSDEQYEWLEQTLETLSKKGNWLFLFMHHQLYSTGDFGIVPLMHDTVRPLLQEHHVDAIFYGHDHHYEAFWVDREEDWGGTLCFVCGAGAGQVHVDHEIMGERGGNTKYVWPGRFLNVRKHGVPPPSANINASASGCRNDELVASSQLLGVLEPHFMHVRVEGDVADFKAIGWEGQLFHHLRARRAGAGRQFSPACELALLDY